MLQISILLNLMLVAGTGTVCILGESSSAGEAALQRVVAAYKAQTGGFQPLMLVGSSLGSGAFGCLRIQLKTADGNSQGAS